MAEAGEHAVALKLPSFWVEQPRVWFVQTESQFQIRNITADATKYHYVVGALDQETANRVLDYIESPPDNNKYDGLKARLLEAFTMSEYDRAGLIIHAPELGDDKPSVLMDKMLALMGQNPPNFLFRRLFLERLPENIRGPLLHSGTTNCRELAREADRFWSARSSSVSPATNAVSSNTRSTFSKRALSSTDSAFSNWKTTWTQLPGGPCAYHAYYGAKARKCSAPCSAFNPSGNASAGRQ